MLARSLRVIVHWRAFSQARGHCVLFKHQVPTKEPLSPIRAISMLASARAPVTVPRPLRPSPPRPAAFHTVMCTSAPAAPSEPPADADKTTQTTAQPTAAAAKRPATLWTIPTILTVARLFAIPPVVALFQSPDPASAALASAVFAVASLTDWLDGYLARKWKVSTPFGAFLDPVADKLMVGAVLVLLCTKTFESGLFATCPWLMHVLAVTILSRELAMSSLREWAATLGPAARAVVDVNIIGKYKTTAQMVALALLLYAMNGGDGAAVHAAAAAGPWLLVAASSLTVYSFVVYFGKLSKFMF